MTAIRVENLTRRFSVAQSGPRRWFTRANNASVDAVRDLSFNIAAGERVAFVGPNGAGKSTTLKMLTGILVPTSGEAEVAGFVPWRDRQALAHRIGIVFGQRSQLWYHLRVRDSFDLLARIYDLDPARYSERSTRLAKVFAVGDLLDRIVSTLSLGQRLRCELIAALLHAPTILFLDEPTIGLDVTAKAALRDHLNHVSREAGATVVLTSHDTGDIEQICERAIVIDHGRLLLDLPLDQLRRRFMDRRTIVLATVEENPSIELPGVVNMRSEPHRLTLSIDPKVTPIEGVVAYALGRFGVRDLMIEDAPLENVIAAIYRGGGNPGS